LGRLAGLTAVAAAYLSVAAPAHTVTIPAAHVFVTLEPDGEVYVLEDVQLRTSKPLDARREVSMQQGELFAEPSVVVDGRPFHGGDGRSPGTFRVARGSRGIQLEWRQPGGASSVRLGYRLALLGTAYTDIVDVDVPVWEPDWPAGPTVFTATARLPRAAHGRVYAWADPGSPASMVTTSRRGARLTARNVPEGKRVTLHVVFPRSVLSSVAGTNVKGKPGLKSVLARRHSGGRTSWPWIAAGAAAVVLLVSAFALRTARRRRPQPR
jgi:hypothetical protein